MSVIFFDQQEIIEINQVQIEDLKNRATQSPRRRARLCLHHSHTDLVQEMVIAFCQDSYVPPHRHQNKTESFHIIEGELQVVFFDNDGSVTSRVYMARDSENNTFLYRLGKNIWHTVVPFTDFVVIHEISTGPFVEGTDEFAPWAPDASDKKGRVLFISKIIGDN